MFKLTPKFNVDQVKKYMLEQKQLIDQALLLRLQRVGERFVKNARENGSYKDHTGNLRNSIGYVILKDGLQLVENFKKSSKAFQLITDGDKKSKSTTNEGIKKAKEVASAIAAKYPKGFAIICVAGMDYSAAVESKGYDVITSSAQGAADDLEKSISELKQKINRKRK
jgi:hypothetical protein